MYLLPAAYPIQPCEYHPARNVCYRDKPAASDIRRPACYPGVGGRIYHHPAAVDGIYYRCKAKPALYAALIFDRWSGGFGWWSPPS